MIALSGDTVEPDARAAIAGQEEPLAVSGEAEVFDTWRRVAGSSSA